MIQRHKFYQKKKTIEANRSLRVRVRVKFLLFYFELAPTDP